MIHFGTSPLLPDLAADGVVPDTGCSVRAGQQDVAAQDGHLDTDTYLDGPLA